MQNEMLNCEWKLNRIVVQEDVGLNPATAGTSGVNKNDYSLRIKSEILYTTNQNL